MTTSAALGNEFTRLLKKNKVLSLGALLLLACTALLIVHSVADRLNGKPAIILMVLGVVGILGSETVPGLQRFKKPSAICFVIGLAIILLAIVTGAVLALLQWAFVVLLIIAVAAFAIGVVKLVND